MKTCISPLAIRRVLYTDTINGGHQAMRDDLWAVSTDELNDLHNKAQRAETLNLILQQKINRLEMQQNAHRPDFLLNGTRFKLNFSTRGNVDVFHNYARELQGRWVALVPAEDDCHLTCDASSRAQRTNKNNEG